MFRSFFLFIRHFFCSFRLHGIHSPFVFDFNKNVIQNRNPYYAFEIIDALRAKLLLTNEKIRITDYGAGSKFNIHANRSIPQILKTSSKSKKYGELLFRISNYLQAENILELGTSLGMGTAYLSSPNPKAQVVTIEGCPQLCKIAKLNFEKLGLQNIEIINAQFDDALKEVLSKFENLDLVFIDGNHTEEASLRYFNSCIEKCHSKSIIILDDIHWSKGMSRAWKKIIKDPRVRVSIDLFEMGIVFFREEQVKEHFTIRH